MSEQFDDKTPPPSELPEVAVAGAPTLAAESVFCFVHIERCAGTVMEQVLVQNWPDYVRLPSFAWPHEPGNYFGRQDAERLFSVFPNVRAFGGHSARADASYQQAIGQPVAYMTMLRDPIDRYVSHYRMLRRERGKGWSLGAYLNDKRFNNWMTWRLAGEPNLELAKRRLRDDFGFIGIAELLEESLIVLQKSIRIDGFRIRFQSDYRKKDRNRSLPPDEVRLRDAALERNQLDIELYKYAKAVYEARKKYVRGNMLLEVQHLRRQNMGFEMPFLLRARRSFKRVFGVGATLAAIRRSAHPQAVFGLPPPPVLVVETDEIDDDSAEMAEVIRRGAKAEDVKNR